MGAFLPIILIVVSIGTFFFMTKPQYVAYKETKATIQEYDAALTQANNLRKEKDRLLQKSDSLSTDQQSRLEKVLPDSVDTVRLIMDINNIASRHGISVKKINVSGGGATDTKTSSVTSGGTPAGGAATPQSKPVIGVNTLKYDSLEISFGFTSSYEGFVRFLGDLEDSLRLIDVTSIQLKPATDSKSRGSVYDFSIKGKTYWLKK